jgi:hypothetical protein
MENEYLFKVYYGKELVKIIAACTKWQAIELVYSRLYAEYPSLVRSQFKAKKV